MSDTPADDAIKRTAQQVEVLAAWQTWLQNGYLQAGHLRSLGVVSRPALAEIVYNAFCAAWVKGRDDLVPSVNAIATRAAAAGRAEEREACARLAEQHKAIWLELVTSDDGAGTWEIREVADLIRARTTP